MKSLLLALSASTALTLALAGPALAHPEHDAPAPAQEPAQAPAEDHSGHGAPATAGEDHSGHGAPATTGEDHSGHGAAPAATPAEHSGHAMPSTGVFGSYPMARDASGTSWQPDVSAHGGLHSSAGDWMVMSHLTLNVVYDWQGGPRGDEDGFVSGMAMVSARRDLPNMGTINLRAMVSPDPLMGKEGYPLLLAAGETADGVSPLVDRQHPHDFFMELSASYTHRVSDADSVFLYVGLPGAPAFGPPAFMHRLSAQDSPEAPITHHWLDSTHITFGVLTAGWVHDRWKLEVSQFRGREPDENRWNIESGDLDSSSARLSFNPTDNLALQVSWADVESPEALEPDHDERRWSASGIYTVPFRENGWWSTTAAWSVKLKDHGEELSAFALESALKPNEAWTLFARAEAIETDELTPGGGHGPIRSVSKLSLGAIRDWRVSDNITLGLGGLYTFNQVPSALEPSYGGDPEGGMVFVRLKVGG